MKPEHKHRAREVALQILYEWEVGGSDIERAIDTLFDLQWPEGEAPPTAGLRAFAADLALDTVRHLPAIDGLIVDTATRWRPERMAIIDRLILRMGACELLRTSEPPAPVVINEALELARTFSSEDSVKFINGMLDAIRKKLNR